MKCTWVATTILTYIHIYTYSTEALSLNILAFSLIAFDSYFKCCKSDKSELIW